MLRKIVVAGGPKNVIFGPFQEKLLERGVEIGEWFDGPRKFTMKDKLPAWCQGVIVITSFVDHRTSVAVAGAARKAQIPLAFVEHKWSTASEVLERVGFFKNPGYLPVPAAVPAEAPVEVDADSTEGWMSAHQAQGFLGLSEWQYRKQVRENPDLKFKYLARRSDGQGRVRWYRTRDLEALQQKIQDQKKGTTIQPMPTLESLGLPQPLPVYAFPPLTGGAHGQAMPALQEHLPWRQEAVLVPVGQSWGDAVEHLRAATIGIEQAMRAHVQEEVQKQVASVKQELETEKLRADLAEMEVGDLKAKLAALRQLLG